jgi:hypothetical protein
MRKESTSGPVDVSDTKEGCTPNRNMIIFNDLSLWDTTKEVYILL